MSGSATGEQSSRNRAWSGAAGCLLALLLACLPRLAGAQDPDEKHTAYVPAMWHKTQVWDYFRRAPQFGWSFDFVLRTQGEFDNHNPFQHRLRESYRPWLVWQIDPLNKLSFAPLSYHIDHGIRWNERSRGGQVRQEVRTTVEFDSSVFLHKRVMFSHRYRYEWRLVMGGGWTDPNYFHRLRLRPRIRVSLNNKSFFDRNVVYAFGYNEVAVHFGKGSPWAFNQNRIFGGLGIRILYFTRLELGYVNQWRGGAGVPHYHSNHGPMTYIMVDYLTAEIEEFRQRRGRKRRRRR